MEIFNEQLKEKKLFLSILIIALFFYVILITSIFTYSNIEPIEELQIELHALVSPIVVGNGSTLQVLVYDKKEGPIEKAAVAIHLSDVNNVTEPLKQNLNYIDSGLYETEVQFLHWGKWDAEIEVKVGNHQYKKNLSLIVAR
ncbi:hypothetical protein BKP45_01195 [Anaerobacillus alkalidiazotrophicus]|uniref:YtkA-like domain-containing protein n=1 Tax=Anaerobacillus alkalidiazotrophicus TaxID=472963 RepID=A0A1S2MA35_9BACI|nr:hypothetical protein [Anaerobacillus alkalidiazotrophicus]OIJ21420.1 hypothetical protein BKP45_01195 [Anaerobacillus alkalidiazotrophicus]